VKTSRDRLVHEVREKGMSMQRRRLSLLFFALTCLVAIPAFAQQTIALSSGKQIKVLGVGKISFPEDGPALMLRYETDIPVSDVLALSSEADEIWTVFRKEVEREQFVNAILSANEPPHGFIITRNETFNFVYKRNVIGTWSRLKSKSKS
jgi:hypothetical protein